MGIYIGIGNYIGKSTRLVIAPPEPIEPTGDYIIIEDGSIMMSEDKRYILLDVEELENLLNNVKWQQV